MIWLASTALLATIIGLWVLRLRLRLRLWLRLLRLSHG